MRQEYEHGAQKARRRMQESADDSLLERLAKVAASGFGTGAAFGGVTSLLTASDPRQIARSALAGGALSGGVSGAANVVGSALMPEAEDSATINTQRGAVGGAAIGAGLGSGAGYALTAPETTAAYQRAATRLPTEGTFARRAIDALRGSRYSRPLGILGGALAGGLIGGYQGADEGMQYDLIRTLGGEP